MTSGHEEITRIQEEVHRTLSNRLSELETDVRNVSDVLSQIALRITRLKDIEIPALETLVQESPPTARQGTEAVLPFLSHFGGKLQGLETQEEILSLMLEGASRFAGRVAFFVAHEGRFMGWSSRGFSDSAAEGIRQSSFAQSESPFLLETMAAAEQRSTSDPSRETTLSQVLGGDVSASWHAVPLKALQRTVALVVALPATERPCNLQALGLMLDLTGLAMENLALRLLQEMGVAAAPEAPLQKAAAPPKAEDLTVDTGIQLEFDAGALEQAAAPADAEGPRAEISQVTSILEQAPPIERTSPESVEVTSAPEGIFQATTPEPQVESPTEAASAATAAPQPQREPSGDEKLHMDAKRFARLLVSEIKLYNEQRVAEGRANKDLYVRLKRDIDRSREMYEKRVSALVSQKMDYFHDELIRILGENDPSKLGSDYPGPRVES